MANCMKFLDIIEQCLISDQYKLKKKYRAKLSSQYAADAKMADIECSIQKVSDRRNNVPELIYPGHLPVVQNKEKIIKAIKKHQVVILAGDTGSGKSTQIAKMCIEAGFGLKGLIGHTQPRRIAAKTISDRIAEECKTQVGDKVGFKIRFNDIVGENCFIKLMTDGILLKEIQFDKFLNQYEVIIVDEAHERSLNIDLLLGFIKKILQKRSNLKVIITSATIEVDKFSQFFNK